MTAALTEFGLRSNHGHQPRVVPWFLNEVTRATMHSFNGQVDTLMAECEDYLDRRLNGELVPEPAAKRIR